MMKQNWKAQVPTEDTRWPFIVIDNWYLPNEEENVWKELEFYLTQKMKFSIHLQRSKRFCLIKMEKR